MEQPKQPWLFLAVLFGGSLWLNQEQPEQPKTAMAVLWLFMAVYGCFWLFLSRRKTAMAVSWLFVAVLWMFGGCFVAVWLFWLFLVAVPVMVKGHTTAYIIVQVKSWLRLRLRTGYG